jgi:glucose-6-phosphate isomerase/transaldolase/glucose-6-phosphate isomerase
MSSLPRERETLGSYASSVEDALARLQSEQFVKRIWEKDATVWKSEAAHRKIISNALGWLTVARSLESRVWSLESKRSS